MQTVADGGVRKRRRAPNACIRCRQQKIKCTGKRPCEPCNKRNVTCKFETGSHKVLVDANFLAQLQRQVASNSGAGQIDAERRSLTPPPSHNRNESLQLTSASFGRRRSSRYEDTEADESNSESSPSPADDLPHERSAATPRAAVREQRGNVRSGLISHSGDAPAASPALVNHLLPGNSPSYTVDAHGQAVYLGTSSNWSFGRRVLNMVHERVNGAPLPSGRLLFQGSTYDLGWNGLRDDPVGDASPLPAADYAMFLINAVKFHCSRLFHIFDEGIFMRHFAAFHAQQQQGDVQTRPPALWFIHYLLILAFGKAFIIRTGKGRSPPGADLFVRAMKMLPDITFLTSDPIQSIEIFICAALYLQCLDMRSAAHNLIGQAMRLAVEQGMHTDMRGYQGPDEVIERLRDTWWTVYILDRRICCLMGSPLSICDSDITATLPSSFDSAKKSLALSHHVQLCKGTSAILRTVYNKRSGSDKPFLNNVKEALRVIAEGSDELKTVFPLELEQSSTGLCRLSASLHIYHHQCLLVAIRPLLFFFWQKRLNSSASMKPTREGGVLSLLRVCVNSAKQILRILAALQAQGLMDSFLPFDREGAFSSATVLSLASAIDASLHRRKDFWLRTAYDVFDEMTSRGNIIAGFHKSELQQLDSDIRKMQDSASAAGPTETRAPNATAPDIVSPYLPVGPLGSPDVVRDILNEPGDFSSEDGLLSGNQLQSVVEAFDFDQLDYWLTTNNFEGTLDPLNAL